MSKKKSASSKRWLDEHSNDHFVKLAHKQNKRSRAHFKLLEIQEKTKLIKPGMGVVDLGAAPGSWSILALDYVGVCGKVVACDLLKIQPYKNLLTVQGDFNNSNTQMEILSYISDIDIVLSDIAPNATGVKAVDQLSFYSLAENILAFSLKNLSANGAMLIKMFHGLGFEDYLSEVKQNFHKVKILKPQASRSRSSECYLLAFK